MATRSAGAATEMLIKKIDAGGAKRYSRHEDMGSEVVEDVKRQRVVVADALPSGRKRKRDADPEHDRSVSESGGGREGPPQLVKPWLSTMPPLQRLLNACRALFTGSSSCTPPTSSAVAFVRGIMDKIGPNEVGLKDEVRFFNRMNTAGRQNPPIITCKPIYEDTNFTIAVFFLPLRAVMPLHDHPGMTVFTKLLIGSARLEAYDWVCPHAFPGLGSRSHRRQMLAQKVRDHGVAAAASGTWVLFPNHGGNMHRFTAADDAHCAFLDVLTPPYYAPMDQIRRCAYYQDSEIRPYKHNNPCKSSTGAVSCDDGRLIMEEHTHRLAWLEEVPKPRDLRIVCLPYRGPTIF